MCGLPTYQELDNACDIRAALLTMNLIERQLVSVTEVLEVAGRGIFVVPVMPYALIEGTPKERLQRGDQLELRKPDGSVARATLTLCSLEWPSPHQGGLILGLGTSITKADVPIGTEIWRVGGAG
jgi:hypothetical protein